MAGALPLSLCSQLWHWHSCCAGSCTAGIALVKVPLQCLLGSQMGCTPAANRSALHGVMFSGLLIEAVPPSVCPQLWHWHSCGNCSHATGVASALPMSKCHFHCHVCVSGCAGTVKQLLTNIQDCQRLQAQMTISLKQCAFSIQDGEAQPWVGWWGQNPLTGKAYLHVNVPPRAQGSFKSCHLWDLLLPGAYFA